MKIKELKGFPKKIDEILRDKEGTYSKHYRIGYNKALTEIGELEFELDIEKLEDILGIIISPDEVNAIAQQCPIKKKLDFIIPTAEQRERQEYEQGMRDEYKRAESDGYKTIG